jgi:hypothetical protein
MPAQAPQQEYARVVFIVILLFFLWSSPDQGPPAGFASPRDYAAERIARSRNALDVLNSSRWQDFSPKTPDKARYEATRYLNLTGFREEDDYAWDKLDAFKKRSEEFTQEAKGRWRLANDDKAGLMGEVYENVTGIVTGSWARWYTADLNGEQRRRVMNLTEISPGVDWAFKDEEDWTTNITGNEGKLMLRLVEKNVEEMNGFLEPTGGAPVASFAPYRVREVDATMTIQDESSSGDGWEMKVHGVHWPNTGVMLMTTTSDKFAGLFGLPHLTPGPEYFETSQKLLNKTVERKIEKLEQASWPEFGNPWSSNPDSPGDATMPVPHCEIVVYVQIYPVKVDLIHSAGILDPATIVEQIEQELRFPKGAPIPEVPRLQMSAVIFSPDCGFLLQSKGPPQVSPVSGEHLVGKKQEVFYSNIQSWLHVFAVVVFGQILLLKIQSKEASTPSTIGRVSLYTVAMMLMADALLFSSLSLLVTAAPDLFPSAVLTSFSALMSIALGVRFIGAIYSVQEPERRERIRVEEAAQAAALVARPNPTPGARPAPIITTTRADTSRPSVIVPNSTPANNLPIIIPSDQDIDAEIAENTNNSAAAPLLPTTNTPATAQPPRRSASNFGAVYVRFSLLLTFILFLSLSSVSWPVPLRTAYIHLLSFTYMSFWIPQIRRNAIRNCRKALLWKFIIGQSVFRLLPFAYFYLREDNILFAKTDWKAFCVLAGWVWIQIWVLVTQEVLGPRWCLPKSWYEEGWDYHPILKEDNVEAGGLPIGLVQIPGSPTIERVKTGEEGKKKKDTNVRSVDCAICMQILEVPIVAAGGDASGAGAAGGVAGMLARRQYMVTPCRHVFHSACLEGWMRFRLQCPICRENLPPL